MHTSWLLLIPVPLTLSLDTSLLESPRTSKFFHVLTKVACSTIIVANRPGFPWIVPEIVLLSRCPDFPSFVQENGEL